MHSAPSWRSSNEGLSSDRPRREAIRSQSETSDNIISPSKPQLLAGAAALRAEAQKDQEGEPSDYTVSRFFNRGLKLWVKSLTKEGSHQTALV